MSDPTGGPRAGQLRPPLRLVRLLATSESPARRKRRRREHVFTAAQEAWIRIALRNARVAFSTWECLADAMGIGSDTLSDAVSGRNRISAELVIRFASATGLSVDGLLHPSIEAAGKCPTCGAARGDT